MKCKWKLTILVITDNIQNGYWDTMKYDQNKITGMRNNKVEH